MAIKLIGNYAKRLGLPGFSSHQFSVSIETELSDSGDIQGEAARIYDLLQNAVDHEIQQTGFVPDEDYGFNENGETRISSGSNGTHRNGHSNGNGRNGTNGGNGTSNGRSSEIRWSCSDKQREFIGQLIAENGLDPNSVEEIAFDRFGTGLKQLNKLQASGLIDELLELCGKNRNGTKGAKR